MPLNALLPVVTVLVLYLVRLSELEAKRNLVRGPVPETLTFRLFCLAGAILLMGALIEYFWRDERLRWATFVSGLVCAAASFGIRRWAIVTLGRFWSLHVEIRESHPLVRSGPFRWVRHPTYLSMILELLAAALILNAFFALAASLIVFIPTLWLRLRLEEEALISKFDGQYRDYQRRTPALFPYKLPPSQ